MSGYTSLGYLKSRVKKVGRLPNTSIHTPFKRVGHIYCKDNLKYEDMIEMTSNTGSYDIRLI